MFFHFQYRDSELDDCRETRGDYRGVARAITAASRGDTVSRCRVAAHQTQAAARKAAAMHLQV
jgi:hypothetical protein